MASRKTTASTATLPQPAPGRVVSFPAIAPPDAVALILGSMPGMASLAAGQYYAHPRNAFWPIMAELLGFDPAMSYARRVQALADGRIALWDALQSCVRPGSLDSAIDEGSMIGNDFAALFARCPQIERIFFNGAAAERCFRLGVLPSLPGFALPSVRLPSTSPAHAGQSFEQKLAAWRVLTQYRQMPQ